MGLRTFTFGGTASSTYSMFITEAATYNVPERAVEMLEIPGRNGAYALDQGRFENVEVTYHVVVHKDTNANFQTELSSVRNWLASKVGYQRLTDDYNSNVYRMAIFKGGLETDETFVNGAEFDIVFECKPQRWLTSGETTTAVANNGTLTNPTLFDSEPLLAVKGYGNIAFNGYNIDIANGDLGDIVIADRETLNGESTSGTINKTYTIPQNVYENGDAIDISFDVIKRDNLSIRASNYIDSVSGGTITDTNASFESSFTTTTQSTKVTLVSISSVVDSIQLSAGTDSTITNTATATFTVAPHIGPTATVTFTVTETITYDATNRTINISVSSVGNSTEPSYIKALALSGSVWVVSNLNIVLHSTTSMLGDPTYIDCEIGECYMYKGTEIVSLNERIYIGSDLPVLASGTNTFTYDNTVTELKVTPRWWKV